MTVNRLARRLTLAVVQAAGFLTIIATGGYIRVGDWPGPDLSPAGLYLAGEFTSTSGGLPVVHQVDAVISESYDVQVISSDLHYAGTVDVDEDRLSGSLTEYRGASGPFFGLDGVHNITLDGNADDNGLFGDYSGSGDEGRFNLVYSELYERASSLGLTSGVWSYTELASGGGVYTVTLTVDSNGELFGSDTDGCVFTGRIDIINSDYNAYRATASVSSCGELDGNYTGLAYLSDTANGINTALTFSISNASHAFRVFLI